MKPEVRIDSKHPSHASLYKTLVLLRLDTKAEPIFFIVEGCSSKDDPDALDKAYYYEEHTCPTNFLRVEAVFTKDDDDPHGLFKHVRTVWMPKKYDKGGYDKDEQLRQLFPETGGPLIESPLDA